MSRATGTEKMEGLWLVNLYDYLAGRMEKSLAGYLSLRKIAEAHDSGYLVATVDWISGFIYSDLGRFDEARRAFLARFEYQGAPASHDNDRTELAFLLGQVDLGQRRLDDARVRLGEINELLPKLAPENAKFATFIYRLLDAEVALAGGLPDKALAAAERLQLMDFSGMNTPNVARYNVPFIKDALARAYWKKGDLDKAVAEYRKLMTVDPKNQIRYFIHPLYHYRLGRVLEEKGDKSGAAVEYRKFLEFWKDADPTHPELADARTRLAAL